MANNTFFGIQIAIRAFRGEPLRARLHALVAASAGEQTLNQKRAFWKEVSSLVNESMHSFDRGYWDFIREGGDEEFEKWTSEIEGSLATEPGEMGAEADESHRLATDIDETRFILVSLIFLVDGDSNTDQTLGERCDLAESDYFTRQTFGRLVSSIPLMNFANVRADAIYIAPGNESDGLTALELQGEDYAYLKALT